MHHQSKERNMSKSKKKKKLTRAFPFGLARFRFNEVRFNEVPLYWVCKYIMIWNPIHYGLNDFKVTYPKILQTYTH